MHAPKTSLFSLVHCLSLSTRPKLSRSSVFQFNWNVTLNNILVMLCPACCIQACVMLPGFLWLTLPCLKKNSAATLCSHVMLDDSDDCTRQSVVLKVVMKWHSFTVVHSAVWLCCTSLSDSLCGNKAALVMLTCFNLRHYFFCHRVQERVEPFVVITFLNCVFALLAELIIILGKANKPCQHLPAPVFERNALIFGRLCRQLNVFFSVSLSNLKAISTPNSR